MINRTMVLSVTITLTLNVFPARIQAQEIHFPALRITRENAFKEIEEQTDYLLSYPVRFIQLEQTITLTEQILPLDKALLQILKNLPYTSNVRGNHILIAAEQKKEEKTVASIETSLPDSSPVAVIIPEPEIPALEYRIGAYEPLTRPVCLSPQEVPVKPDRIQNRPQWAVRTNLLYGFGTFTPNGGIEMSLNPRSTLLLTAGYNAWRKSNSSNNKKLWHRLAGIEYRYWPSGRFNSHFFGIHTLYSQYNISGKKIPMLLEKESENYRYEGYGLAAGLSYGYQFILGKHWNLELNAGIGAGILKYNKWDCNLCSEQLESDVTRAFIAPTKLGISIIYMIK